MRTAILATLLLLPALGGAAEHAGTGDGIVFSQRVETLDPTAPPPTQLHPDAYDDFDRLDFPLGRHRSLRILTDLPTDRRAGLAAVAARVHRCYAHVEAVTDRRVQGGVLLYLPASHHPPATYDFRVEIPDRARWSQVRLALLNLSDPLCATLDDPALTDLLLDTLPHELGHELMASAPTIRPDLSDGSGRGTRWFEEGVCELLAKTFSAAEDPLMHRRLLAERNVADVLDRNGVRTELLDWTQARALAPSLESDLYGAAMLTVMRWTEVVPLSYLLDRLNRAGGNRDGWDLLQMMQGDLGCDLLGSLDAAAALGRSLSDTRPRG